MTATANSTGYGYAAGQSYHFIFTLAPSVGINAETNYGLGAYTWGEENTGEDAIWASVSGSGVTGTYARPTSSFNDPYSGLSAHGNFLELFAAADASNVDLKTPDGTTLLRSIDATDLSLNLGGPNFPLPVQPNPVYVDPNYYFPAYTGSYNMETQSGHNELDVRDVTFATLMSFTTTNLTISAVPEPATYAVLLGVASLVLVARRRLA